MAYAKTGQEKLKDHSFAVIQKPGSRETPFDIREILYRVVSNITQVNLVKFSDLDECDDVIAYEEMAIKVVQPGFLKTTAPGEFDIHSLDVDLLLQVVEYHMHKPDSELFCSRVKDQIFNNMLCTEIKKTPVKCMKGIFRLAKVAAEKLKAAKNLPVRVKHEMCQALVDGIYFGCEDFEMSSNRQVLKSYINIWELDETPEGGTKNLLPLRTFNPPLPDVALEGAELMKHMIYNRTNYLIPCTYFECAEDPEWLARKAIVEKLAVRNSELNPITHSFKAMRRLLASYDNLQKALKNTTNKYMTRAQKMHLFQLEVQETLLEEILQRFEHKFELLAGLFMVVSAFLKFVRTHLKDPVEPQVLSTLVEATYEALREVSVDLRREFDTAVWLNFENHFIHLVR